MAIFYSPTIERADYPSFSKIIRGMPRTFADWQLKCGDADVQRAQRGIEVVFTAVSPAAFAEYVRRPGNKANVTALYAFAFELGSRGEREKAAPSTGD